ncbi:MAG: hypothetical protein MK135_08750 [Polyangiaceae bacterium]|nr:hypothetical protein [Polyangiaceae bacterium]
MKKTGLFLIALASLSLIACGGGASKSDACGCLEEDAIKSACELTWDACDELSGGDKADCKDALQDVTCPS